MNMRDGFETALPHRLIAGILTTLSLFSTVEAWGGDIVFVPMAWCIVNGSPAQADPNILGLNGILDTTTEAVIWRRHERPTEGIYTPRARISLRSGILRTSTTFRFPFLDDPIHDPTRDALGTVSGWDVELDPVEYERLIDGCDMEYDDLGLEGVGITAVNITVFHDNADGRYTDVGDAMVLDYIPITGWGGCTEITPGVCSAGMHYDGRIMVIDNRYLYPTVDPELRRFPPTATVDPGPRLALTDPFDLVTAHEVGHALGLHHDDIDASKLMYPEILDRDMDGRADNRALSDAEVRTLELNASAVFGAERDPPAVFEPGNFIAKRLTDQEPDLQLAPHLDLASSKFTFDVEAGRIHFGDGLRGLIPCDGGQPPLSTRYVYMVDSDNDSSTGAQQDILDQLGIDSRFVGADLVAVAHLEKGTPCPAVRGGAVIVKDGLVIELEAASFEFTLLTLRMYPHFARFEGSSAQFRDFVAEVNHVVVLSFENSKLPFPIALDRPFRAQSIVTDGGGAVDRLEETDAGRELVLQVPIFPHCFPRGDGIPGGTVEVSFDNLLPNKEIHALLGPDLVLDGVITDDDGAGLIDLPIPGDARPGAHLVTIGHDELALTADCTVEVREFDLCDLDQDGDVDRLDLRTILIGRGESPQPGDPRDIDGDGRITTLDSRQCYVRCSKRGCRP